MSSITLMQDMGICVVVSSLFTSAVAGALFAFSIPVTVILPTSAPIWIGMINLGYLIRTQ